MHGNSGSNASKGRPRTKKPNREVVKSRKLAHLSKEPEKRIDMIFPPIRNRAPSVDSILISVLVYERQVGRVLLDGGAACDIIYEHCFLRLRKEAMERRKDVYTTLLGFYGLIAKMSRETWLGSGVVAMDGDGRRQWRPLAIDLDLPQVVDNDDVVITSLTDLIRNFPPRSPVTDVDADPLFEFRLPIIVWKEYTTILVPRVSGFVRGVRGLQTQEPVIIRDQGASISQTESVAPPPPPPPSSSSFICPICFEPLVNETATKCGHVFCQRCIGSAIMDKPRYPICRDALTRQNVIRVYFPVRLLPPQLPTFPCPICLGQGQVVTGEGGHLVGALCIAVYLTVFLTLSLVYDAKLNCFYDQKEQGLHADRPMLDKSLTKPGSNRLAMEQTWLAMVMASAE
ncbi:E3 ubiquitin protein ligase RNF4-like protein, partial [Tanacetum coccineum]